MARWTEAELAGTMLSTGVPRARTSAWSGPTAPPTAPLVPAAPQSGDRPAAGGPGDKASA